MIEPLPARPAHREVGETAPGPRQLASESAQLFVLRANHRPLPPGHLVQHEAPRAEDGVDRLPQLSGIGSRPPGQERESEVEPPRAGAGVEQRLTLAQGADGQPEVLAGDRLRFEGGGERRGPVAGVGLERGHENQAADDVRVPGPEVVPPDREGTVEERARLVGPARPPVGLGQGVEDLGQLDVVGTERSLPDGQAALQEGKGGGVIFGVELQAAQGEERRGHRGVLCPQGLLRRPDGSLQQLRAGGGVAEVGPDLSQQGQVVDQGGVVAAEDLLAELQRPLDQRTSAGGIALRPQEVGERMEALRAQGVVGSQGCLGDVPGTLEGRPGAGVIVQLLEDRAEIVQGDDQGGVRRPEGFLADPQGLLVACSSGREVPRPVHRHAQVVGERGDARIVGAPRLLNPEESLLEPGAAGGVVPQLELQAREVALDTRREVGILFLLRFQDRARPLETAPGPLVVPHLENDGAEAVEALRHRDVVGTEGRFPEGEGPLVQSEGSGVVGVLEGQQGAIVEGVGQGRVVGPQVPLLHLLEPAEKGVDEGVVLLGGGWSVGPSRRPTAHENEGHRERREERMRAHRRPSLRPWL